ncbi:MAG: hypothetical protein ACLRWA_06530 [Lachnospira sp.]
MNRNTVENVINVMTNEFPAGTGKKTYENCIFIKEETMDYMSFHLYDRENA